MARITVEDCLQQVNNRFTLIHMAAQRVRQLRRGSESTLSSKNKDIVVALREIAAGHITKTENSDRKKLMENNAPQQPEGATENGNIPDLAAEEQKEK